MAEPASTAAQWDDFETQFSNIPSIGFRPPSILDDGILFPLPSFSPPLNPASHTVPAEYQSLFDLGESSDQSQPPSGSGWDSFFDFSSLEEVGQPLENRQPPPTGPPTTASPSSSRPSSPVLHSPIPSVPSSSYVNLLAPLNTWDIPSPESLNDLEKDYSMYFSGAPECIRLTYGDNDSSEDGEYAPWSALEDDSGKDTGASERFSRSCYHPQPLVWFLDGSWIMEANPQDRSRPSSVGASVLMRHQRHPVFNLLPNRFSEPLSQHFTN